MAKTRSTDDPRPARLTPEVLKAVKAHLRKHESGDHDPELQLGLAELKAEIKGQGITVSGDQLVLALKRLTSEGLIRGAHRIGMWHIDWISPKMETYIQKGNLLYCVGK